MHAESHACFMKWEQTEERLNKPFKENGVISQNFGALFPAEHSNMQM